MKCARLGGAAFLMVAFFVLPTMEAWAQKEKKAAPPQGGPTDSAKLPAGEYVGILKGTPGSDRSFTLEMETSKLVATGGGGGAGRPGGANGNVQRILQAQNRLQQAQVQLARATNAQARQRAANSVRQATQQLNQAMLQIQRAGGGGAPAGYRVEKQKVLVEFQAADKAKVRTMLLPETFDDKGNLKKYTRKELDELKGTDKGMVGYESSLEKLENGQKIRVVSAVVRPAATKGDKDKDEELDPEKSKQVKMIVVLEAADPALIKGEKKKKK